MITNLQKEIQFIFSKLPQYWDDEVFLKNKVIEDLREYNTVLLEELLKNKAIKNAYVIEIEGQYIFKSEEFISMLQYKNYLDNSYTKYSNEIGLTSEGKYLNYSSDVVLDFPHKDGVLEGGMTQEDAGKDEVFYHNILAKEEIDTLLSPKVFKNIKKITKDNVKDVSKYTEQDNLIIKGNNLIALHSIKNRYKGRVKLIYIDPPFNTGKDSFKYNDRFSRSTWLTFMKNRLEIAKELLSEDGNIFIHIDKNESHYLKILLDTIFGENNFVDEYIWSYGSASGGRAAGKKVVNVHDYILHYAKNYKLRKANKIYTPYSEKYIKDWFKYVDSEGRLYRRRHRGKDSSGETIWERQYLDESKGVPLTSVWSDIKQVYANPQAYKKANKSTSEIELEFGNSGQKPEKLLQRIIEMASDPNDIILDFFMGSGTTPATALKMNRRFIGIEQINSQVEISTSRLLDAIRGKQSGISKDVNWNGGGSFIYLELYELNQKYINEIKAAKYQADIEKVFEQIKRSPFLNLQVDLNKAIEKNKEFKNLTIDEQKMILIQIIDHNQLYLSYSEIDDEQYQFKQETKAFNASFYEETEV